MSTPPVNSNNGAVDRNISTEANSGAGRAADEKVPSCLTAAWEAIKNFFAWLFSCCCCCCRSDPEPVSHTQTRSRAFINNGRVRHRSTTNPPPTPAPLLTTNSSSNASPPAQPTFTQPQPAIQPQPIQPLMLKGDSSLDLLNSPPDPKNETVLPLKNVQDSQPSVPHLLSEKPPPQPPPQTVKEPTTVVALADPPTQITVVLGAALNGSDATVTKLMQNHVGANAASANINISHPIITNSPVPSKPLSKKPIAPPQAKKKPIAVADKTYPPLRELAKNRAKLKFFVATKAPEMPASRPEPLIEPLEKCDYSKEGEASITQLPISLNNAQSFASFKNSFLAESNNFFKKILAGTCEQVKSTYGVGVQHPSQINIAITIAISFCNGRFAKVNDLLRKYNEGIRTYNEKMQQQGKLSHVRVEFEEIDSGEFFKQYSELQETAPKWNKILDTVWQIANKSELENEDINALEAVCQELPIKDSSFYTDFSDLTKQLIELFRLMDQKLVIAENPSDRLSTIRNALVDKLNLELNWLIPQAIFDQALQRTLKDHCNAILPLFQKPEGVPEDQINFTTVHVDQIYDYLENEIRYLNSAAQEYIEEHDKFDIVFEPLEADKIRAKAFEEIKPLYDTWGMMKKMTSYREAIDMQIVFLEGIAKNLPSSLSIIWGRYPILKLAMREILKKDYMGIKDTENPSPKPIGLFSNYTFEMCRLIDPEKYDKDKERKAKIDAAFNTMAEKLDCEIIAGESEFYVDQEADAKEATQLDAFAKQFTEQYNQELISAVADGREEEACQLFAAKKTAAGLHTQIQRRETIMQVVNLMPSHISQYINLYIT